MRSVTEIKKSGKVLTMLPTSLFGIEMYAGQVYDRNENIFFTMGVCENGWEHVAVHVGRGKKLPTWDVMCKVKSVFWRDDEDVVQIHPRKSDYFHGFDGMEVLHLWRPCDGDWGRLNDFYETFEGGKKSG